MMSSCLAGEWQEPTVRVAQIEIRCYCLLEVLLIKDTVLTHSKRKQCGGVLTLVRSGQLWSQCSQWLVASVTSEFRRSLKRDWIVSIIYHSFNFNILTGVCVLLPYSSILFLALFVMLLYEEKNTCLSWHYVLRVCWPSNFDNFQTE